MKIFLRSLVVLLVVSISSVCAAIFPIPEKSVEAVFAGRPGAWVFMEAATGKRSTFRAEIAAVRIAPCSTFKIWNTLIGLEMGILTSPDQAFYQWDGQPRFLPEWNQDLTLKQAFQYSCVPAFQNLARQIGVEAMQRGLDQIGYGDRNLSSGIDVFWLPAPGRKSLLISPVEQVEALGRLVTGKLPFSARAQTTLKEVMGIKKTERGSFYGKTGTSSADANKIRDGWFVGYVESGGQTYVFACLLQGPEVMGKDARAIVETLLEQNGYL